MKNKLFQGECQARGLKFGTSAFHSYVHEWGCQLRYNPRLNKGSGRSDGEGLERIWSFLSPLVSPLRYSTKQHRLDALHWKATHCNVVTRTNAVRASWMKVKEYERLLVLSKETLLELLAKNPLYTHSYFSEQWERQKKCQLDAINVDVKNLEEKIAELLELEEKLEHAHTELKKLQRKRRRQRTEAEVLEIHTLPSSIVEMQTAIETVREELGDPEFRQIHEFSTIKGRALIRVRLAKMKLYEAKVGILEAQKRWDRCGLGTSIQQTLKNMMSKKQLMFRRKWASYESQVTHYNKIHPISDLLCPTLDEAKQLPFDDPFWNIGAHTHPTEQWASDPGTIDGIQAHLLHRSCLEELRRIGRETQQMTHAALRTEEQLEKLQGLCNKEWDAETGGKALIESVQGGQRLSKDVWEDNIMVMKALHKNLLQHHCRTWMAWNSSLVQLLKKTCKYTPLSLEALAVLVYRWESLRARTQAAWDKFVNVISIESAGLDDLEVMEQNLLLGEDVGDQPDPVLDMVDFGDDDIAGE
ncbi:hypothetical protein DFH28DRAFT_916185 [Melampsora americana]|nr:hypothetical protein DFH28DRAFT_916185 [Melampsora americana]